jgi:hypothetical protein
VEIVTIPYHLAIVVLITAKVGVLNEVMWAEGRRGGQILHRNPSRS